MLSLGQIEVVGLPAAIEAADVALKAANVELIEARNQPGGKGMVVVTGDIGAVRSAVAAAVATVKPGMLVAEVIIPYAHEALRKNLMP